MKQLTFSTLALAAAAAFLPLPILSAHAAPDPERDLQERLAFKGQAGLVKPQAPAAAARQGDAAEECGHDSSPLAGLPRLDSETLLQQVGHAGGVVQAEVGNRQVEPLVGDDS